MRLGLLLVFAAIPFVEIALMIKVGQTIGFWPTLALISAAAALGTFVLYEQGFQVMGRAMAAMQRGQPPVAPVVDGVFLLLAGLLLIVPGFLTDAFGLALLVPRFRHGVARWCIRTVLRSAELRGFVFQTSARKPSEHAPNPSGHADPRASAQRPAGEGPVIEGEFHHVGDRTVDKGRGGSPQGQR
jgi:UPF0716 protein FxsA